MAEIGDRIAQRRNELGLSQAELGRRVGMKQGSIGSIEAPDGVKRPRKLLEIAAALQTTQLWLLTGKGLQNRIELHETLSPLETMGISSAGIWRDTSLGLPTMKGSPIAGADTRFPADKQYLIKIEGNSIDKLAGDGSYAHCVDFDATGRQFQDLDIVLAERAKPDGTVETTIKRVKLIGGTRELWPESTDPVHQPFFDNGDPDIMVQVIGLVLSFHGPKLW